MNNQELIDGHYYVIEYSKSDEYLFHYSKEANGNHRGALCIGINTFYKPGYSASFVNNSSFNNKNYRLANQQEIQHLIECIRLDKFIPFNKVKQQLQYEIY